MEGSCSITLTLEALLDLSSGAAILEEEISVLRALFWLSPDFENVVPPSVNAPEPRRSKRVMSITGYYATIGLLDLVFSIWCFHPSASSSTTS